MTIVNVSVTSRLQWIEDVEMPVHYRELPYLDKNSGFQFVYKLKVS